MRMLSPWEWIRLAAEHLSHQHECGTEETCVTGEMLVGALQSEVE